MRQNLCHRCCWRRFQDRFFQAKKLTIQIRNTGSDRIQITGLGSLLYLQSNGAQRLAANIGRRPFDRVGLPRDAG